MTTEPTPEALVNALLQAWGAQHADEYAARGRRFAALNDHELQEHYVRAYKAFASDPHNLANVRDTGDLDAEFSLRNQSPPFALIMEELEVLRALAKRAMAEDPALQDEHKRELEPIARMLLDPKSKH